MNRVIWVAFCCFATAAGYSQYYVRGEVKDERGRFLQGVKITFCSKGSYPYYTGAGGTFGIPTSLASDTICLSLDGYEMLRTAVDTRRFQSYQLKMLPTTAHLYNRKLASLTTNLKPEGPGLFGSMGESYTNSVENGFVESDAYPETGFALNIDKASYSNIRRFLNNDMKVPEDAVRIEEMLNYFDFSVPVTTAAHGFTCSGKMTTCPWNAANDLLFLKIQAPKLQLDNIPPSNLVFLIDISGSMDKANRLPLLQSAFKMLAGNLRDVDTLSIVTYGGGVGIRLRATSGSEKKKINEVIDSLVASGDTPGSNAINIAYELAAQSFIPNGNNRVILATDGDFNVGQTSEKELEEMITRYKQTGIYLTCLGVGMGNYKDSKLETLSKKGNGNFSYIDNLQEAQKVLVTEFTQTMYSVANNTFLKIRFRPGMISEYRLIGFDNSGSSIQDSTSELEGGEVGSGHSMMALFEIVPRKGGAPESNSLFADVWLRYRDPANDSSHVQQFGIAYQPADISSADSCYRFAAAVAMFGSVLKRSRFTQNTTLQDVLNYSRTAIDPAKKREAEFLALVDRSLKIYRQSKTGRKK